MEISYTQLKANGDRIVLERRESLVVERSDSKLVTRKQTLVREQFSSRPSKATNSKNSVCKEKNHGYNSTEPKSSTFAKGEVMWQKRFNSLAHAIDSEIIKLKQKRDKIRKRIAPKGDNLKTHDVSVQCNIDEVKDFTPSKTNIEVSIEKYSSEHKFACTSPRYALDEQTLCRPRMRTIGVQMSSRQSQRSNNNSIGFDEKDKAQTANQEKSSPTIQKKIEDKKNNDKKSKLKTLLSPLPFDGLGGDPNEAVKLYHMQCALPLCKCNCQAVQACPPANATAVVCNQKQYVERSMSPGKEYNYCYNEYYCNYPNRCHQKSTAICCQPPKTALSSPCCQPCCPPCCVPDNGGRRNTDLNTDIFFHPTKCDDSCTCKPKLSKLEECRAENEKLKKIMLSIMKRKKRQGHSGDAEKRRSCDCCRSCEEQSKKKSDKVYKGAGDNNKRSKSQDDRQWEDNLRKKLRKQSAAKIAKLLTRDANKDEDDGCMGSDTPSSLQKSEEEDIMQSKKERRSRSAPQDDDYCCDCFKYCKQEPDLSTEAQQTLKQMRISPYQARGQSRRDKSSESRKPRQKRSSRRDSVEGEQSKAIQKTNGTYSPQGNGKEQSYEEYINRYKEEPDSETSKKKQSKYDTRQSQNKSKGYGDVIDSSTLPEEFINEGTPPNLRQSYPYNPYQTSGEFVPEQMGSIYVYPDGPAFEQSYQGESFISSPTNIERFPRPSKDEYIPHSTETARSSKSQSKSTTRPLSSLDKSSEAKSAPNKKGKQTSDLSSSDEKRTINAKSVSPKTIESEPPSQKQPRMPTGDQLQIPIDQRQVSQKAPTSDVEDMSQYSSKSHQNYKFSSPETSPPDRSQHKLALQSKAHMPLHDPRKAQHQQEYALHEQERKRFSDSQHLRPDDGKQIQNSQGTPQPTKMKYKDSSMEPSPPDSSNQTSFLQSKGQVPSQGSRSPPQMQGHYSQRTSQGETDPQRERSYNIKQIPHLQDTQQSTKINSPKYSPQSQAIFSQPEAVRSKYMDPNALNQSQSYFQQTSPKSRPTTPTYDSQREFFLESQLFQSQSPQFSSQSYQGITPSDMQPHTLQSQTKHFSPEIVQRGHMDSNGTNQKQSYFQKTTQKPQPTAYDVQKGDFVNSQPYQPQSQSPRMEVSPNQSSQYQSKYSTHQRRPSPDLQLQQPLSQPKSDYIDYDTINQTNFQGTPQKSRPTTPSYDVQKDRFLDSLPCQPQSQSPRLEVSPNQSSQYQSKYSPHQRTPAPDFQLQQPLLRSQIDHTDPDVIKGANIQQAVQSSPTYGIQEGPPYQAESQPYPLKSPPFQSPQHQPKYSPQQRTVPPDFQIQQPLPKSQTDHIYSDKMNPTDFQHTAQKSCPCTPRYSEQGDLCPHSQSFQTRVQTPQTLTIPSKLSSNQYRDMSPSDMQKLSSHSKFLTPEIADSGCMDPDVTIPKQFNGQLTLQKSQFICGIPKGRFGDSQPCQPQSQSPRMEVSPNQSSQYQSKYSPHQRTPSPDLQLQQPLSQPQTDYIDYDTIDRTNFQGTPQKSRPTTPSYDVQKDRFIDSQPYQPQSQSPRMEVSPNQSSQYQSKYSPHQRRPSPDLQLQQPLSQPQSDYIDYDTIDRTNFQGTPQKSRPTTPSYDVQKDRFIDSQPYQPQSQSPRMEVSPNQSSQYQSKYSPHQRRPSPDLQLQQPLSQPQSDYIDYDTIDRTNFQGTPQKSRPTTPSYDVQKDRFIDSQLCQPQSQSPAISPNRQSQQQSNSPYHQYSGSPDFEQPLLQSQNYRMDSNVTNPTNLQQTVQKSRPTSPTYDIHTGLLPDSDEFSPQPKEVSQYQQAQFVPDISPYEHTQRVSQRQIYQQQRLREPRPTTRIRNMQRNVPNLSQCRCKRVFLCPSTSKNIHVPSQQSLSDSDRTIFSCCRHRKSSATKFRLKQPKCINSSTYDKYSPVKRNSLLQRQTQNFVLFKDPCQFLPDSRNSSPHRNYLPETQSRQSYKEQVCFTHSENAMRRSPNIPQLIENSDQPFYPLPNNSQPLLNINTNRAVGQKMQQLPSTKCFPDDSPPQTNRALLPLPLNQQQFTHNIVSCAPDVSLQTNKVVSNGNFIPNSDLQQMIPQQNMRTNNYNDNYVDDNAQEEQLDYSDRECFSKPSLISVCDSDNGSWVSARTTCFNGYDCNCQQTDDVETSEVPPGFDACPCMFNTYIRLLSEYYDKEMIENAVNCK